MRDLQTTFAGLHLKSPIIVSSSSLTNSPEKNKRLSDAGAGAIVLKSLFEEQISLEAVHLNQPELSGEGTDYLKQYIREHSLNDYIKLIQESKAQCDIPIIASINCFSENEWVDFAQQIEKAGADALEINILALQTDCEYTYGSFEQRHITILSRIKKVVRIPIVMKLGSNLTNPVALINQLYANGAAAVVLFNRFYQPDINIETLEHGVGDIFTHPSDFAHSLRWIGISSASVRQIDYAASGGISSPENVVKAILAGASAVEVCSAIYKNTDFFIGESNRFLHGWMKKKGFETINSFKGKLNAQNLNGINTFERTQFLKYYSSKE